MANAATIFFRLRRDKQDFTRKFGFTLNFQFWCIYNARATLAGGGRIRPKYLPVHTPPSAEACSSAARNPRPRLQDCKMRSTPRPVTKMTAASAPERATSCLRVSAMQFGLVSGSVAAWAQGWHSNLKRKRKRGDHGVDRLQYCT